MQIPQQRLIKAWRSHSDVVQAGASIVRGQVAALSRALASGRLSIEVRCSIFLLNFLRTKSCILGPFMWRKFRNTRCGYRCSTCHWTSFTRVQWLGCNHSNPPASTGALHQSASLCMLSIAWRMHAAMGALSPSSCMQQTGKQK